MAVTTERESPGFWPVADPAPLGLAAFALTTFVLSGHNASFVPHGYRSLLGPTRRCRDASKGRTR
jgi:succinate-acetate transporter protein